MVVDVDQVRAVAQDPCRVAVDVAAVKEHDRALRDVRGRRLDQALQAEDAVLERQRQIIRRDENLRVLAQLFQQSLHPHQRPQRVAVGTLVRGQHETRVLADVLENLLARRRGGVDVVHDEPISSISASTRIARSVVSS